MSWIMMRILGWVMSLPYQLVAAYGWPGLAVGVCAAMLAFKLVKASTRKLRTAAILGAVGVAALSFLPKRTLTAAAVAKPVPAKAEEEVKKEEPVKKKVAKKAKPKKNPLFGKFTPQIGPSGTPPGVQVSPKGSIPPSGNIATAAPTRPPQPTNPPKPTKRKNQTPRDDKALARQKRMQEQRQQRRDVMKDLKGVRDRLIQRQQQRQNMPPRRGQARIGHMPGGMGQPHMGGHGGAHR